MLGPMYLHVPNLYTVRGDKLRSALRYVESVDRLRALEPEVLITGHGDPIRGAKRIHADLTKLRDAVQWVHDQTVAGMNAGTDLFTLMREITPPPELALGEGHGKVMWNVRAIWEEYAGWFRYESTTELYAVPPRAVFSDLVELAGGADALAARAASHVAAGRPDVALAVKSVTTSIPIVFDNSADPVQLGLVASLARPGGNVTGYVNFDFSMGGKWLQTLKTISSGVARAGPAPGFAPAARPCVERSRVRLQGLRRRG